MVRRQLFGKVAKVLLWRTRQVPPGLPPIALCALWVPSSIAGQGPLDKGACHLSGQLLVLPPHPRKRLGAPRVIGSSAVDLVQAQANGDDGGAFNPSRQL